MGVLSMWVYLAFLVALVGAFIMWIASNPGRWYDAGRLCFGAGLLAFLIRIGWHLSS
jgi:hypothetical protein